MTWFARARFPKSPLLVSVLCAGLATSAQDNALIEAAAPTEAELCERSLAEVHAEGLNKRLETIRDGLEHDESAIAAMKASGMIKDKLGERRVLATLRLGTFFLRQGIMHEAVYQTFKGRYDSNAKIADALHAFARISEVRDKITLISEVVERVLQYTPDVDTTNLAKINATAAFLAMTPDQLQELRDKFVELDQMDEFVNVLQGGILAALTSANEKFIAAVQARSGTITRFWKGFKAIEVPNRPDALSPDLTLRQVQIEDRRYFADEELFAYWGKSSSAARRFFLMSRLGYLTRSQIQYALDNRDAWLLKDSLVKTLQIEMAWRARLAEKNRILASLRRDLREADVRLARLENRARFNEVKVQQDIKALRQLTDPRASLAAALEILSSNVKVASSSQFVNVVTMITSNAPAIVGDGPATVKLIDEVVARANEVGVLVDHADKLTMTLKALAERASGRDAAGRARADEVKPTSPKYEGMDLAQITQVREDLASKIEAAEADLEREYKRVSKVDLSATAELPAPNAALAGPRAAP